MTTTLVKRPHRVQPPQVQATELVIAEPPGLARETTVTAGAGLVVMPVLSGAGSLTLVLTNPDRPVLAVTGLLFLVGSVAVGAMMIVSQTSGPRRLLREGRERYLDYIEQLRHAVRETLAIQRAARGWRHPALSELVDLAGSASRRWERRPQDPDFLVVRIGTGDDPIASPLTMAADTGPLNQLDPLCLQAARELQERYSILHEQPITLDLREMANLSIVGPPQANRDLATSMALQLATLHSPDEVSIAVVRTDPNADAWDWVKWLPHTQHPRRLDGDVPARRVATSVAGLSDLIDPEIQTTDREARGVAARSAAQIVVFVDCDDSALRPHHAPADGRSLLERGVHVVWLVPHHRDEPDHVEERVEISDDATAVHAGRSFRLEEVPAGLASIVARQLAGLRPMPDDEADAPSTSSVELAEMLGVDDVAQLDPWLTWRPRPPRDQLRVPIGVGPAGTTIMLDLKESAHGGMGPHGLLVGATGSGKSELLRTLVTSLAIGHAPDQLALMLVDFKGGATFAAMSDLPHVAGMITNLQDDLTLVDRMRDALHGEMLRRQELLKAAGNLPNLTAYAQRIAEGERLAPLPHLLVIVDEFAELLAAKPDFAELFVAIGRIGRSIGMHLLLATQKLEMGTIRGLESHLSYRISLRTFSEGESREAIGASDAYHLPTEPGSGYLKVGTTVFERFRAALASSPYEPPGEGPRTSVPVVPYVAVNGLGAWIANQHSAAGHEVSDGPVTAGGSTLDVVCQVLVSAGAPRVRPIWVAPLASILPLDTVMDTATQASSATVVAHLGVVDDPAHQRQFPLRWDFSGPEGNLVVVGGPQSGKSTLVRALIASLALVYAPGDVVFYCIDYGGGTLRTFADIPHVAAVATRVEPERIRRTVGEVNAFVESREEFFREQGIESMAALRIARAEGRVSSDVPGDVFLVIDGWGSFREDFESLEPVVAEIAARGLTYGVHVVLTVGQTMQVRMRMQPAFAGRLELRLTDAFDSAIDRRLMEGLPRDVAGRGLADIGDGLVFQTAAPRIDGGAAVDPAAAQAELVRTLVERWPTTVARVEVLPAMVEPERLPAVMPGADLLPIGLSERDLGPATVNLFGSDPHLLVYGDGETGKTSALRLLVAQLLASRSPEQLGIIVVDYRRSLLDVVPPAYLVAYCTSEQQTSATAAQVAGAVRERLPGQNITAEQLRARSWWQGIDIVVVADDFDLVSSRTGNPLQPLLEFVPQGRDLGLHLVLARRTGGLSRAVFEPLLQRLADIGTPGLLLSGDRLEGRLVNGATAQRLPVGRAIYAARGGSTTQVQLAYLPPDHAAPP